MEVLFDGDVPVHYGSVYVDSGVGGWNVEVDQRAGQRNGLLGAAQPGFLQISTGMHTGLVPLRVEAHDSAPPLDDTYDEVVEASCDLRGPELSLLSTYEWATSFAMPQGGPHRVRLSAHDLTAHREQDRHQAQGHVRGRFLLQLWPASMTPDAIIKVTGLEAASWHAVAGEHPAAAASPHEQALAEQAERDDDDARRRAREREQHLARWGGRDPSPRLLQVQQHALALTRSRRDLVDALAALPPDRQRAVAVDLARRACAADHGPLDWQPALDALTAGDPLPAPFNDPDSVRARLFPGPVTARFTVAAVSGAPPRTPLHTGLTADATVRAAAAADPLEAALRAVHAASWSAPDLDAYFSDVTEAVARG